MRNIVLALVSIVLPSFSVAEANDWKIQLGWTSGWGDDKGIYIDSIGQLGKPENWSFDKIVMCPTKISDIEIIKIYEKIKGIPREIPADSRLDIVDHCDDEREHMLIVKEKNMSHAFSYTQQKECLSSSGVPTWLSSLVDELEVYRFRVRDCQ